MPISAATRLFGLAETELSISNKRRLGGDFRTPNDSTGIERIAQQGKQVLRGLWGPNFPKKPSHRRGLSGWKYRERSGPDFAFGVKGQAIAASPQTEISH